MGSSGQLATLSLSHPPVVFTLNRFFCSSTWSTPSQCPRWFFVLARYNLCCHKTTTQAATLLIVQCDATKYIHTPATYPDNLFFLFFSFFYTSHVLPSPFCSLSHLYSRNSDPGSHPKLFSLLPTTVRASHFFIAGRFQLFVSSSTRVELCLPTLGALRNWLLFIFLQTNSKSRFEGYH